MGVRIDCEVAGSGNKMTLNTARSRASFVGESCCVRAVRPANDGATTFGFVAGGTDGAVGKDVMLLARICAAADRAAGAATLGGSIRFSALRKLVGWSR